MAQRMPGAERDRRLLRVQGLPDVGPRAVRDHGRRLRHAAPGLGAGRRPRPDDRGGRGPADLPGRVAGLRRLRSTTPIIGWPITGRSSRRRSIAPAWSPRGGVWDDGTPPARTRDRRRLAGRPTLGSRPSALPRPTPIGSRAGITTSRGDRPLASAPRPAARSSSWHASSSAATAWAMPRDRRRVGRAVRRPPHRDGSPARAVPSGRLGEELRGLGDRPVVRGHRPQPDRRQRHPQGLVDPRADHASTDGSARSPSSSTSGRARSPTRTGRSATSRRSPRSPIGCMRSWTAVIADPLLDDFWPRAIRRRGEVDAVGLRFSLARREIEAAWGVPTSRSPWACSARPTASSGSPRT